MKCDFTGFGPFFGFPIPYNLRHDAYVVFSIKALRVIVRCDGFGTF